MTESCLIRSPMVGEAERRSDAVWLHPSAVADSATVVTRAICSSLTLIMAPPSTVLVDSSLEAHGSVLGGTLAQPAALVTRSGTEEL